MSLLLAPDDLSPGMFCSVHTGQWSGCRCSEVDADLKGVPLAVHAVSLPYVLVLTVPSGQRRMRQETSQ